MLRATLQRCTNSWTVTNSIWATCRPELELRRGRTHPEDTGGGWGRAGGEAVPGYSCSGQERGVTFRRWRERRMCCLQLFSLSPLCVCAGVGACTRTSFASAIGPEALFLLRLLGKMFAANQWWATGTCVKRPHHQWGPSGDKSSPKHPEGLLLAILTAPLRQHRQDASRCWKIHFQYIWLLNWKHPLEFV